MTNRFPLRDAGARRLRLHPLAAAFALLGSLSAGAQSLYDERIAVPLMREDGAPIRTSLRAWHQQALVDFPPSSGPATTRVVTNCDDDGPGSLRATIAGAAAWGDTIDLTQLACGAITLETGAIAIHADSLELLGPGSDRLAIDGNGLDRVFLHYGGGAFNVRNLTVTGGSYRATGFDIAFAGCIASAGYLTLDHSVVTGCYAGGEGAYGGAIYAYSLILYRSTLSNNVAYGIHEAAGTAAFGGAAFVYQLDLVESTVTGNVASHRANPPWPSYDIGGGVCTIWGGLVVDSTIDSNYANGRGGGLATFSPLSVTNSTISGNTGLTTGGGGLFVRRPANLVLRNSTIAFNHGRDGGGLLFWPNTATIESTIIAANGADGGLFADLSTQASDPISVSGGNNLISSAAPQIALPADTRNGDPGLRLLADNGGPTRTHALRGGSPAIDAGTNPANLSSDQRGLPRVLGAAPDIGAFELDPAGVAPIEAPVPARSAWAAALMLVLFGIFGARAARRKRERAPHARLTRGESAVR